MCVAVWTQADGSGQMQFAEFMHSALRDALAEAATQVADRLESTQTQEMRDVSDAVFADCDSLGRHEPTSMRPRSLLPSPCLRARARE